MSTRAYRRKSRCNATAFGHGFVLKKICLSMFSSQKQKDPNPSPAEIRFGSFFFGIVKGGDG